jgi:hypothetical protein
VQVREKIQALLREKRPLAVRERRLTVKTSLKLNRSSSQETRTVSKNFIGMNLRASAALSTVLLDLFSYFS